MNITFEQASVAHKDSIFNWLEEPHVKEFWDNSQPHKDDILKFINGRIEPSSYCDGLYTYWVGLLDGNPYCLIMTLQEKREYDIPAIKKAHLSTLGSSYSVDYMIGNRNYFGKGLGSKTLHVFTEQFFRQHYDPQADTFFIDPAVNNPRARHVYEKAGFEYVGDFLMEGNGAFAGTESHFLVKRLSALQ